MTKPKFITFTGVDDQTDPEALTELNSKYPVEFGMLFSRSNEDPKYIKEPLKIIRKCAVRSMSAHLCGSYARSVLETGDVYIPGINLKMFDRIQVNATETAYSNRQAQKNLIGFFQTYNIPLIVQWRKAFPIQESEGWKPPQTLLYDCSGGRGEVAEAFPKDPGYFVGFAGGFGPDNINMQLAKIKCRNYYIDMEGKIRVENRFSVDSCRKVCEAVYDN